MSNDYKRTIEELVLRYTLEPSLRDVLVEGAHDCALLSWYAEKKQLPISVYEISTVNVPQPYLGTYGNRGRVIAVARRLETELPPGQDPAVGLIDRDLDSIHQGVQETRLLWLTDYASIDCYSWSAGTLAKLFALVFQKEFPGGLQDRMEAILRRVFLTRAARAIFAPELNWVTFTRCCTYADGLPHFDEANHEQRLYQQGRMDVIEPAREWVAANAAIQGDVRMFIHGHDAVELLSWIAQKLGVGAPISDARSISRALLACIEVADADTHPLWQRLHAWAKPSV